MTKMQIYEKKTLILHWEFVHRFNWNAFCQRGSVMVEQLLIFSGSSLHLILSVLFFKLSFPCWMVLFYFIILDLLYMYKASSWCSSWEEECKHSHTILSRKISYSSCVYLQHVAVTHMARSVKNSAVTVATGNRVIALVIAFTIRY